MLSCQEKGLAHRDIKTDNFLMDEQGALFLSDFSESILFNEVNDTCSVVKGTPSMMAPELKAFYDQRCFSIKSTYNPFKTDIYSLGLVFLQVLVGQLIHLLPTYSQTTWLQQVRQVYGESMAAFVSLMLSPSPQDRPDFLALVQHPLY